MLVLLVIIVIIMLVIILRVRWILLVDILNFFTWPNISPIVLALNHYNMKNYCQDNLRTARNSCHKQTNNPFEIFV